MYGLPQGGGLKEPAFRINNGLKKAGVLVEWNRGFDIIQCREEGVIYGNGRI